MKSLLADQLRQAYLGYFAHHGHSIQPSGSLIPTGDASLMFTNAGMVPFKNVFVGAETRPYRRATTCQKCMRVSGKHNDLEAVGRTARHHTFFEMLGNFSFGDYFKEEAIVLAWRFLNDTLQLPRERLWITVFGGGPGLPADAEAAGLWQKISGLPAERIVAKGVEDNFWSMGDTGPCGPCTEIHFDQGSGPVSPADFDNGRVMELWNNVFMQFNRDANGLQPLPAPSVDTGMGLERVAAVLQGADSNYHSDAFLPLLAAVEERVGRAYRRSDSEDDVSMRVLCDHARATTFLVADGVQPSAEGRGYVLRRIMRRAIRHGRRLGIDDLFLHQLCDASITRMAATYPELTGARSRILKVAEVEETSFRRTLEGGLQHLDVAIAEARAGGRQQLSGKVVFRLYDTFGFPRDLTEVIAQEQGLQVDAAGFDAQMQAQQARSRGVGGPAAASSAYAELAQATGTSTFVGGDHEDQPLTERPGTWRQLQIDGRPHLQARVRIAGLIVDGVRRHQVDAPAQVELVLDPCPLYPEGGGQVGDTGALTDDDGQLLGPIIGCRRPLDGLFTCQLQLERGNLQVDTSVWAGYDAQRRRQIRAHHSATHLLHGALRTVLGDHVAQAGSRVDDASLRFDYSHFAPLSAAEVAAVEADVNARIAADNPVQEETLAYAAAKERGAIALFGEKYGDSVRVISMGPSVELCGGCHAAHTGELQFLLILREEAVQSGVRRIEARAGQALVASVLQLVQHLAEADALLASPDAAAAATVVGPEAEPSLQQLQRLLASRRQMNAKLREVGLPAHILPAVAEPLQQELAHWRQTIARLSQVGAEALSVQLDLPAHRGPYSLAEAQACRDLWTSLVRLLVARPTELAALADASVHPLLQQLAALMQANREAERQLEGAHRSSLSHQAAQLVAAAQRIGPYRLVAHDLEGGDSASLRILADDLRGQLGDHGVVCLGAHSQDKAALLVALSPDLLGSELHAGRLMKVLAPYIDGRGGGGPALAQAGGNKPGGIAAAFDRLQTLLQGGAPTSPKT